MDHDGRLDIHEGGAERESGAPAGGERPFLQVFFRCANFYQRVYRNAAGTHYVARCPKCSQAMRFAVGQGGTDQRRFEVSC